jgi:hypothetical protein
LENYAIDEIRKNISFFSCSLLLTYSRLSLFVCRIFLSLKPHISMKIFRNFSIWLFLRFQIEWEIRHVCLCGCEQEGKHWISIHNETGGNEWKISSICSDENLCFSRSQHTKQNFFAVFAQSKVIYENFHFHFSTLLLSQTPLRGVEKHVICYVMLGFQDAG